MLCDLYKLLAAMFAMGSYTIIGWPIREVHKLFKTTTPKTKPAPVTLLGR